MKRDKNKYVKTFKVLGQNIRNIRKNKDLSQEELAFMVSSARNYIGCIERAEKFPSIIFILDIASALKCNAHDLFENV